MKCTLLKTWLADQELAGKKNPLPDNLRAHLQKCQICGREEQEAKNLESLLGQIRTPDHDEKFWGSYLTATMEKARSAKPASPLMVWSRRLAIPAAAFVVLLIALSLFNPKSGLIPDESQAYSTTLDFVLEEHELIMSEHMFDPTSIYAMEEIIFEEFNDNPSQNIKN